jgi:hypothetical protein
MAKITKADLEAKIEAQEALIKALEKSNKSSKKATTKKVAKKSAIITDGFHLVKRIESLTGGKDIRIHAITKDGKITGYFLANLFKGYDGHAKGAHIAVENMDIVFETIRATTVEKIQA